MSELKMHGWFSLAYMCSYSKNKYAYMFICQFSIVFVTKLGYSGTICDLSHFPVFRYNMTMNMKLLKLFLWRYRFGHPLQEDVVLAALDFQHMLYTRTVCLKFCIVKTGDLFFDWEHVEVVVLSFFQSYLLHSCCKINLFLIILAGLRVA